MNFSSGYVVIVRDHGEQKRGTHVGIRVVLVPPPIGESVKLYSRMALVYSEYIAFLGQAIP